ncbi:PREDICTED: aspartyl/asparaginyl beta-hydroxylase-like isoform X7 [Hipposideros armiger]|uniref:Aspartyl/asparaginyl beta-hydroxylase-like isoform X7 n=1 Tax=Hipposideros armiger TaxID=186990 RepID=A0A8B7QME6_HIPAR|nr:PREDICTED: aspartyl/asparaginyl beta-hydroxylase-like isoform X7 [Hipposideros armiger]
MDIRALRDTKHKNGRKGGIPGSSFFTWFMVIALLGVWTSVAVVWFELVDYEEVLAKAKDFRYNLSEVLQGKLGVYDADGDGDFDVDDAKVLLGLTKDGSNENIDSLEEVLNILAEESSDWFYGFLSFLYDIMTPFEMLEEEEDESETADGVDEGPGGVAKRKTKAKVKELTKEELKKEREKSQSRKESKNEERKKGKKEKEDDRKDKKVADSDISRKEPPKGKKDKEKEKVELDKGAKTKESRKKSTNTKDISSKMASREKDDRKEGRSSTKHARLAKGDNQKRKN